MVEIVGASGGQDAVLHLRRVFDPFETHLAIGVGFVLCGCARVRLEAHVGLNVRPLIGRAAGLRGSGVWYVSFGSDL